MMISCKIHDVSSGARIMYNRQVQKALLYVVYIFTIYLKVYLGFQNLLQLHFPPAHLAILCCYPQDFGRVCAFSQSIKRGFSQYRTVITYDGARRKERKVAELGENSSCKLLQHVRTYLCKQNRVYSYM